MRCLLQLGKTLARNGVWVWEHSGQIFTYEQPNQMQRLHGKTPSDSRNDFLHLPRLPCPEAPPTLTSPEPLHPMVDDSSVVFLVLYTPGRQALNRFHGVGYRLEFSIQRGLQSPCRRGRRGGGLTAASAAAGRHLPGLHKRCCSSGGGGGGGSEQNNHCECVRAVGGEGGQGEGTVHARGPSGGSTGGPAAGHAGGSYTLQGGAVGFEGLSELLKGLCLNQSVTEEKLRRKQVLAKPFQMPALPPKSMVSYFGSLR